MYRSHTHKLTQLYRSHTHTHPAVSADMHKDENESEDGTAENNEHEAAMDGKPHAFTAQTTVGPHGLVVLGEDESRGGTQHPRNDHQDTYNNREGHIKSLKT